MKYTKIRKILTILVIFFGLISFIDLVLFIGSGGVLNELDLALEEVKDLEKKNLLNNPPENISESTKFYLSQFDNPSELEQHIKEYETHLSNRNIFSCIFTALFLLSLILRIYFRKGRMTFSS